VKPIEAHDEAFAPDPSAERPLRVGAGEVRRANGGVPVGTGARVGFTFQKIEST
jgi:hypothetical protein